MKPALHLILQIYIDHEANQPLFSGHRHHIEQKKRKQLHQIFIQMPM